MKLVLEPWCESESVTPGLRSGRQAEARPDELVEDVHACDGDDGNEEDGFPRHGENSVRCFAGSLRAS